MLEELKTETGKVSQEILAEMTPQGALGETYARSVVATLTLHLSELKHPWSRSVLEIAAFLHPGGILIQMLAILSTNWPLRSSDSEATADDFELHLDRVCEAVEELHSRSLLVFKDGAILHRMAQRAMRACMTREDNFAALQYILKGITAFLADTNNPMKLAQHSAVIPHATVVLPMAEDMGLDTEIGYVAFALSSYFLNRADFASAIQVAMQAESHFRAAFGEEHETVAGATNNRGYILREMGDLDAALRCHTDAERINRKLLGNHHPNVARDINNRGAVLQEKNDLDSALCCYEEAEGIFREAFGDEHPDVATAVNNRGCILELKGDLNGALRCFEESEHIDRKILGSEHPNVARTINNRGKVLLSMGELERALCCFQQAEEIDRAVFGGEHPNIARDVNNRGMVLKAIGDLEGALCCLVEGERIDRNAFGDNHPIVARDINNRGMLLLDMGDMQEATRCFEESKRINMLFSDDHQSVATNVIFQGSNLHEEDDNHAARECASNILQFPQQARPKG